ncbi:tRNA lysidine(34) synthetase TilS [Mycoplasma sp. 1018B]|uniref:tRNA lysidine(34) synthetase TilS n=1 Tax=Mycoplasma sp. 1018B TaxID=2967302 RepID=UPI00211C3C89|nr:tRNA lysidine(34) synthetase TilS [Mycoplasma sp. 1018B]UUM19253.1 tRNA lysidine(34) synthetase TilS [Mycoplasma sp. 1018B]
MLIKRNKNILVAVSGGPDSMLLLNLLLKKYNNKKIYVATINYNFRDNSNKDVEIVREFCKKKNISLFVKNIFYKEDLNYKIGNFENQARNDRYDFFRKIYFENNIDCLFLAHHKDDFLETFTIQKESNRKPLFYGIKTKSFYKEMLICRPFIKKYFKNQIMQICAKKNIDFALDYTNYQTIFTRNIIRVNYLDKLDKEKNKLIKIIKKKNKKNIKTQKKIDKEYWIWEKTSFDQNVFVNLFFKKNLIFKLLNTKFTNLKISSKKIVSIIQFIESQNRTSNYKIDNKNYLYKVKGKLIFN